MAESWAELRKTQWPTGQQVVQGTLVVGFVTLVFAVYLALVDGVAVWVVNHIDDLITG